MKILINIITFLLTINTYAPLKNNNSEPSAYKIHQYAEAPYIPPKNNDDDQNSTPLDLVNFFTQSYSKISPHIIDKIHSNANVKIDFSHFHNSENNFYLILEANNEKGKTKYFQLALDKRVKGLYFFSSNNNKLASEYNQCPHKITDIVPIMRRRYNNGQLNNDPQFHSYQSYYSEKNVIDMFRNIEHKQTSNQSQNVSALTTPQNVNTGTQTSYQVELQTEQTLFIPETISLFILAPKQNDNRWLFHSLASFPAKNYKVFVSCYHSQAASSGPSIPQTNGNNNKKLLNENRITVLEASDDERYETRKQPPNNSNQSTKQQAKQPVAPANKQQHKQPAKLSSAQPIAQSVNTNKNMQNTTKKKRK